jgi:MinD-like ATPase involved in chromosome partitioning or flagellar assembly
MSLVAVTSAKGAPGATTFAAHLAVALARRGGIEGQGRSLSAIFLVDADPDGGDLALTLGLDPVPGIGTLALAGRHGIEPALLFEHSHASRALPGVRVVPGISGRAQAPAVEWCSRPLAAAAAGASDRTIVVDVGRVGRGDAALPLFEQADQVIAVCRPDTPSVVHCRSACTALAALGISATVVVVGSEPESAPELAAALGRPILGVMPVGLTAAVEGATLVARARASCRSAERALDRLCNSLTGATPPLAEPQLPVPVAEKAPGVVVGAALRATERSVCAPR